MATTENNGLMIYQDESGNKFILYPITKADLVDGLEELLAGKAAAAHAGQHASGGSDPITPGSIGAAPSTYVETTLRVPAGTEDVAAYLDSLLDSFIATKPNYSIGFVNFAFSVGHPVLGGQNYIVKVNVTTQDYVSLEAIAYTNTNGGVTFLFTRSKHSGVWSEWARNYNTYFKPTPADIGFVSKTIILASSGWDSSAKTQTVTVSGVSATETAQLITPTPALASQTAYYDAGILCTGQAGNSLTFTAKAVPTTNLTVYVTIQEVSQG